MLLKTIFIPRLGPIRLFKGIVQVNRVESMTFGQTSRLRLETSVIRSNYPQKLYNTTLGSIKPYFLLVWVLFVSYKAQFRPIGAESLSFCRTRKLRQEKSLFHSNYTWKLYIIRLTAFENFLFSMFRPNSALIKPSSGQSRLKF